MLSSKLMSFTSSISLTLISASTAYVYDGDGDDVGDGDVGDNDVGDSDDNDDGNITSTSCI